MAYSSFQQWCRKYKRNGKASVSHETSVQCGEGQAAKQHMQGYLSVKVARKGEFTAGEAWREQCEQGTVSRGAMKRMSLVGVRLWSETNKEVKLDKEQPHHRES